MIWPHYATSDVLVNETDWTEWSGSFEAWKKMRLGYGGAPQSTVIIQFLLGIMIALTRVVRV